MAADGDNGAVRELMVVLALAMAGLLLGLLAALAPWYRASRHDSHAVVELHAPPAPVAPLTKAERAHVRR